MEISSNVNGWSPLTARSDALDDLGTHQLDLLRFICRCDIESVRATQPSLAEFHLGVRLVDGSTASCRAAYRERSAETIEVVWKGTRICARVGSERISPGSGPVRRALDVSDTVRRRLLRRKGGLTRSYKEQLTAFADCVRGQTPASPSLEDGLAVLRAIGAARASLRSDGAPVPTTSLYQL
jgi:predicted dehydrogenase